MRHILTLIIGLFCILAFAQTDSIVMKSQTDSVVMKLNSNQNRVDTVIKTEKIEIINKSFDNLVTKLTEKKDDKNSIWDILTPLLIGAGLTLLTQWLIELWKTEKEKLNKKQELISRGRAKTYLIV